MRELLTGRRLAHLTVGAQLSRSPTAEVYEGRDEKNDRPVAIKVIRGRRRLDASDRARFLRLSRALARLQHPGICRVFDWIETPKADLLVLELVTGRALNECSELLSEVERLQVALKVAEAIEAAHREGILHLDLQPSHVLVTPHSGVKVINFGLARLREERGTEEGDDTQPGAVHPDHETIYASPEQVRGEPGTNASDLYSLGILLLELVTGLPAYPDVPRHELRRLAAEARTRPPEGLDHDLTLLLLDLLSLDPEARPPIGTVVERLRRLFGRPLRRRLRRQAAVFGSIAAILLAIGLAVTYQLAGQPRLLPFESRGRVLLLPFTNQTGDPSLDWVEHGLRELVARALDRVNGIDLVEADSLQQAASTSLGKTMDRLNLGEVRRLASLLGAELSIQVAVKRNRERVVLEYQPISGTGLRRTRRVHGNDLFTAATTLARRLSQRLSPDAEGAELEDELSGDPLTDRLYGIALQHEATERLELARDFLSVTWSIAPTLGAAGLDLASCERRLSRWGESERIAARIEEDAASTGNDWLLAAAVQLRSRVALDRGDNAAAHDLAIRAESLARAAKDIDLELGALATLTTADLAIGNPASAEGRLLRRLELLRWHGDRLDEAPVLFALGAIVGEHPHRRDEALGWLRESVALAREVSTPEVEAMAANRVGLLRLADGQRTAAVDAFRQALDALRQVGDQGTAVLVLDNLATVELEAGSCERAAPWLQQLEQEARTFGDERRSTDAALDLAICLVRQSRPDEAEAYLSAAAPALVGDWRVPYLASQIAVLRDDRAGALASLTQARTMAGDADLPELDEELEGLRREVPTP